MIAAIPEGFKLKCVNFRLAHHSRQKLTPNLKS